jgi:hypothetical protein
VSEQTARDLLAAYASAPAVPWQGDEETTIQQAPTAFATLRAVLDVCQELAGEPVAERVERTVRDTLAKWTDEPDRAV